MPIYRTAMEIERLKRRIENHVHHYVPDARIEYRKSEALPWMNWEHIAATNVGEKTITIDDRVLVSWPEEEIWKTVNHELAHLLSAPDLEEEFPLFPNLSHKQWHSPIWVNLSRVLGGDETPYTPENEYPKRFRMRCTTCGLTFYSNGTLKTTMKNGEFELLDRYNNEPESHPTSHRTFYVEDIITRRRRIIPRDVPHIAQAFYGLW